MQALYELLMLAGIQAPSADNEHVFRSQLDGERLLLWPTRGEPADWRGHERALALLSLGAVLANIELRAMSLGYRCVMEWLPTRSPCWMSLRFEADPSSLAQGGLAAAIERRHTDRRLYRRERLAAADAEALASALGPEAQLHWLDGAARGPGLALLRRAETARFRSRFLHQELFSSIRFDLNWRDSADHKLPPAALAIEAPMRPMFKSLRHWALMRCLRPLGVAEMIAIRAALVPAWFSAGVGVISVPAAMPADQAWLSAGRSFERVWLQAAAMGLALQPFAASAVLQSLDPAVDPESRHLGADLRKGWEALWPSRRVAMVFRVGRVEGNSVRTGRQPLSAYLR